MDLAWNHSLPVKPTGPGGVRTVKRETAGPGMESLTDYQANRTREEVKTVRRITTGPGMESLTACQANRMSESEDSEKGHSWTCHGITHILSSQ